MRHGLLLGLAMAMLTAGCSGSGPPHEPSTGEIEPFTKVLQAVDYACVPGDHLTTSSGVCAIESRDPLGELGALRIAYAGTNSSIVAMAVKDLSFAAVDEDPQHPGSRLHDSFLLVSHDGGSAWTEVQTPHISAPAMVTPGFERTWSEVTDLLWDRQGRLHIVGTLNHEMEQGAKPNSVGALGNVWRDYTFHAMTADLGATWPSVHILSGPTLSYQADLSLLSNDRMVLVWEQLERLAFATSLDDGSSWSAPVITDLPCEELSLASAHPDEAHVACYAGDEVTVWSIAPGRDPTIVGSPLALGEVRMRLVPLHFTEWNESSMAVGISDSDHGDPIFVSLDGARSWHQIEALRGLSKDGADWQATSINAMAADGWGGLQVLATWERAHPEDPSQIDYQHRHLVLDSRHLDQNATLLHDSVLHEGTARVFYDTEQPLPVTGIGTYTANCLAFNANQGVLCFEWGAGLAIVTMEPRFGEAVGQEP